MNVQDWLTTDEKPVDYYQLLCVQKFSPDHRELQRLIRGELRQLIYYQNHSDKRMAEKVVWLQRELARAADVFSDAVKAARYDAEMLGRLKTDFTDKFASGLSHPEICGWLESVGVHKERLNELSRKIAGSSPLDGDPNAEETAEFFQAEVVTHGNEPIPATSLEPHSLPPDARPTSFQAEHLLPPNWGETNPVPGVFQRDFTTPRVLPSESAAPVGFVAGDNSHTASVPFANRFDTEGAGKSSIDETLPAIVESKIVVPQPADSGSLDEVIDVVELDSAEVPASRLSILLSRFASVPSRLASVLSRFASVPSRLASVLYRLASVPSRLWNGSRLAIAMLNRWDYKTRASFGEDMRILYFFLRGLVFGVVIGLAVLFLRWLYLLFWVS